MDNINSVNNEGIDLLKRILSRSDNKSKVKVNIDNLETIVNMKFKRILENTSLVPLKFFLDLQNLNSDLKELSIYPRIFGKTLIGVGGCFSSGKSNFINSILEERLLPVDTVVTTSFPTYIVNSEYNKNILLTTFNEMLEIDKLEMKSLSHKFYEEYDIDLSSVVDKIFVENNSFRYENIALLDTPGYNSDSSNGQKDIEISYNQLSRLKYIIWVIDINNGGLRNDDIDFIKSLGDDKEIFFIINKADTIVNDEERKSVYKHIENQILSEKINCLGISLYCSKLKKSKSIPNNYFGKDIKDVLSEINTFYSINFLENIGNRFKDIILEIDAILADIEKKSIKISKLLNDYDVLTYKLKDDYTTNYSNEDTIEIINNENSKKTIIETLKKEVNNFIVEYVRELQLLFENIEIEFQLEEGSLSNYRENIELENIRIKNYLKDNMSRKIYFKKNENTRSYNKVISKTNDLRNNLILNNRDNHSIVSNNNEVLRNEPKAKKKNLKQELSKINYINELKKMNENN